MEIISTLALLGVAIIITNSFLKFSPKGVVVALKKIIPFVKYSLAISFLLLFSISAITSFVKLFL